MLATVVHAKEPKPYQSGKLLKMESVKCGTDENKGKSITGEVLGTDSAHMKTREMLCKQYVLETDSRNRGSVIVALLTGPGSWFMTHTFNLPFYLPRKCQRV